LFKKVAFFWQNSTKIQEATSGYSQWDLKLAFGCFMS